MGSRQSQEQKQAIASFISTASTSEDVALKYLKQTNFNLENALDNYNAEAKQASARAEHNEGTGNSIPALIEPFTLESEFSRYMEGAAIYAEGIQRFCTDLGITPMDPVILVISKYFQAETMGIYTKPEFLLGMASLNVASVHHLKAKLPSLREEFADRKRFKETYRFTFKFAKEPGKRNLSHEIATEMWRLLLSDKYPQTSVLMEFMSRREKQHDISADTWNMLLDFFDLLQDSGIASYRDDGAWPIMIDELAEFMKSN